MKEQGSGFHADPVEPLLTSSDPNFRPVAPRVRARRRPLSGRLVQPADRPHAAFAPRPQARRRARPDLADHYNGRPLVEKAKIAGASVPELLDLLKVYEDRTRYRARRELREHKTRRVISALDKWTGTLYKTDPDYWRLMLESLWLKQSLDQVDPALLQTMLTCPEPRGPRRGHSRSLLLARSGQRSTRVCSQIQVNDKDARVRLEAVRALSFFDGDDAAKAQEIAMESLLQEQDYYLKYTLDETNKTLDRRIKAQDKK